MPLSSLYLISLIPSTPITDFVHSLQSETKPKPLLIARTLGWVITPWLSTSDNITRDNLNHLSSTPWDLLVIFSTATNLPASCSSHISTTYSIHSGIPSKLLQDFTKTNHGLLHPRPEDVPTLTGSLDNKRPTATSSKNLELTPGLVELFSRPEVPRGPVAMLNLLALDKDEHESYKEYGRRFAADVGVRRGGFAKLVGRTVVMGPRTEPAATAAANESVWDEIALAHYPSVWHWADMALSEDYQAVNVRYRIPAVLGTGILCCDELDGEVQTGIKTATSDMRSKM